MSNSKAQDEFHDDHDWNYVDQFHYLRLKLAEEFFLPKALAGDVRAIQDLLKVISEAIVDGARINKVLADFLSSALLEIYQGANADQAFGIARKRGGKNTRFTSQKSFEIAFFIESMHEGTLEVKFQKAADEFYVAFDTAKKAWSRNHAEAKRLIELNKKYFLR